MHIQGRDSDRWVSFGMEFVLLLKEIIDDWQGTELAEMRIAKFLDNSCVHLRRCGGKKLGQI